MLLFHKKHSLDKKHLFPFQGMLYEYVQFNSIHLKMDHVILTVS